jgi:hypothetical protein
MPKHVGTWVMVVEDGDLIKFGKDSDTEFPCDPDDKEAMEIAEQFAKCDIHSHIYIAHVFDNGQMKTFEYEGVPIVDYTNAAPGYCQKCRSEELMEYDRILGACKKHESICAELKCKHPAHYFK